MVGPEVVQLVMNYGAFFGLFAAFAAFVRSSLCGLTASHGCHKLKTYLTRQFLDVKLANIVSLTFNHCICRNTAVVAWRRQGQASFPLFLPEKGTMRSTVPPESEYS